MGEALGRVGRQVEDVRELMRAEDLVHELRVGDRAGDEGRSHRDVLLVAAAEVVEDDDVVACLEKVPGDVGADEAGAAGDEDLHRGVRLAALVRGPGSVGKAAALRAPYRALPRN